MEIKILWSDTSLSQLEDIYNYYKLNASQKIASRLVKHLVKETIRLKRNPLIGTKEPLLAEKIFEYRYLVSKNYKIIYRFNDGIIRVIAVFDCRQNPEKIQHINDPIQ